MSEYPKPCSSACGSCHDTDPFGESGPCHTAVEKWLREDTPQDLDDLANAILDAPAHAASEPAQPIEQETPQ